MVLYEDDLSEKVNSIEEVADVGLGRSMEVMHVKCKCGAEQRLGADDVLLWVSAHHGHTFTAVVVAGGAAST